MTDPDDDAFTWEGDEGQRPVPAPLREPGAGGGAGSLLALGVLGGIALIETAFWVRGVLDPVVAATVDPRTAGGTVPLVVAVGGRVLAVAAPIAWFGAVLAAVRVPTRRIAWLVLGAALLIPWPAVLAAA